MPRLVFATVLSIDHLREEIARLWAAGKNTNEIARAINAKHLTAYSEAAIANNLRHALASRREAAA